MFNFVPGRPITNVDSTALYPLGQLYFDLPNGKWYRYVEGDAALDSDTLAAQQVLTWMDNGYEVTNDVSEGMGVGGFCGVAISAITESAFGWIQTGGQATVLTDGGVSAGEALVPHSENGEADTMADGEEEQVFAVALQDDHETVEEVDCHLRGWL